MKSNIFGYKLTAGQTRIVSMILNPKHKRVSVCAMTRYGKTRAVAIACLLHIIKQKTKIALIAPTNDQTNIIRNYIAEHIADTPQLANLVDIPSRGDPEHLKKEMSKKRVTFKNGSEIYTLTAYGAGEEPGKQLMGFGADLVVLDEACLILDEVYRSRISRMLGDSPDSKLVEMVNPWHRQNFAWRHWQSPNFKKIHIGWQEALAEGRVTETFIKEQRAELSDYEFTVLYDSLFAEDSEDTLIRWNWIEAATKRIVVPEEPQTIWGLDVGEQGPDQTILTCAQTDTIRYKILSQQVIREKETMPTANAVAAIVPRGQIINVDSIGVGAGVHSRLRELGHHAVSIRVSESATVTPERYLNLKAQRYWQLRTLFETGFISIPEIPHLTRQLSLIRYEFTSAGKIKIVDPPDKSPDFADSCCLALLSSIRPPRAATSG